MSEFSKRVGTAVKPRLRVPRKKKERVITRIVVPAPAGTASGNVNVLAPAKPDVEDAGPVLGPHQQPRRWQTTLDFYWTANHTVDKLPPGLYRASEVPNVGIALQHMRIDIDDLMELPDSPSQEVLEEIRRFWGLGKEFKRRGFLFKRGVMLWGPPGSGKTATINQLMALVVEQHQGVGFFVDNPSMAQHCLQMLRSIERSRPIIALIEDLDALVERHSENEFLALLDGEAQVANIVFVATTNYPERLDRRFVDRPSRFDLIKQIGMPTAAARHAYLSKKEPSLTGAQLVEWVKRSEGFSIAHLRELIILCCCYGQSLEVAIKRLAEMRSETPHSKNADDGRHGTGLGFLALR